MAEKKQVKMFDAGKPYAVVYGHVNAKFEQNGILYGGNGAPIDKDELADAEAQMGEENKVAEAARKRELVSK